MKACVFLVICLLNTVSPCRAQLGQTPRIDPATGALLPEWTHFDLDFPGGRPSELIEAFEKAMGKPVNAIVSGEDDLKYTIPAFKVADVTLKQVFDALLQATQEEVAVDPRNGRVITPSGRAKTSFGFRCFETNCSESSVWTFKADEAPAIPVSKGCQFYSLAGYLGDYKVEDITTTIETGWSMLGVSPVPKMKYHPETQLLIVVGTDESIRVVEGVLQSLQVPKPTREPQAAATETAAPRIVGRAGAEPAGKRNRLRQSGSNLPEGFSE